jgi:broad specificity phosphatase PhoE
MTRLLLIRHGNTDLLHEYLCGRTPGISLNEEGRQQARPLGQSLCERYKLAAVYSSPLERAMETAGFVAQPQSLSVIAEEGVNELDFGAWAGARFRDLHNSPEWQSYNQNRSLRSAPGGETLSNVQSRAWTSRRGRSGCQPWRCYPGAAVIAAWNASRSHTAVRDIRRIGQRSVCRSWLSGNSQH